MAPMLGSVLLVAFGWVPAHHLACDGSPLPMDGEYAALYSLLGGTYGQDLEARTFNIPRINAPEGMLYVICTEGTYPTRW